MTYREQLNKVNKLGINICDLTIASELECVLDFPYSEKDFERLCDYAKMIYLKADKLTAEAIANSIYDLITQDGFTVGKIVTMETWKVIAKSYDYM